MSSRTCFKVAAFVTLILATMVSGGCVDVEVVDRTSSVLQDAVGPGADEASEHDLAVLAVDFDPPLEYEEIIACRDRGEGITLLVAVENTGISVEQKVTVQVQLSESDSGKVFLHKEGTIASIVPGEIKIVQFRDTDIPFSYEYSLDVDVLPVAGETRLVDNQKSYELLITRP
jgi:hypothetical protein